MQDTKLTSRTFCLPLLLVAIAGCAGGRVAFPVDPNGPVVVSSPEEICSARKVLSEHRVGEPTPPGMRGGMLVDGIVTRTAHLPNGMDSAEIRVEKQLLGTRVDSNVTVVTPSLQKGGVQFTQGRKYRIFMVLSEGQYYTWSGTGTFERNGTSPVKDCSDKQAR